MITALEVVLWWGTVLHSVAVTVAAWAPLAVTAAALVRGVSRPSGQCPDTSAG